MYAKNVTTALIFEAAKAVGLNAVATHEVERERVRFTLKCPHNKHRYASRTPQFHGEWRRTSNVCFHGHYAFFEKLFNVAPEAIVTSTWYGDVTYTAGTFAHNANNLGNKPLGREGNIFPILTLHTQI